MVTLGSITHVKFVANCTVIILLGIPRKLTSLHSLAYEEDKSIYLVTNFFLHKNLWIKTSAQFF